MRLEVVDIAADKSGEVRTLFTLKDLVGEEDMTIMAARASFIAAHRVALVDFFEGRQVPGLTLEVKDGGSGPAMHPEWFFRRFESWDWWERELLPLVSDGPVLDLGAGAGRASLYFQQRGLAVTAVDASPAAVRVCRGRGVADVRLGDVNDPPADRRWGAVLLLCGNLGLGGSWDGNRTLLTRLDGPTAPGAVLVGDSGTPHGPPRVELRIRYQDLVSPWWAQYNIPAGRMSALVEGTGWTIEEHLIDRSEHAVLLRRDGD